MSPLKTNSFANRTCLLPKYERNIAQKSELMKNSITYTFDTTQICPFKPKYKNQSDERYHLTILYVEITYHYHL